MFCLLLSVALALGNAACTPPFRLTQPVTKLGLVAPFEGAQRALGYEVLYGVKLALREQNAAGGVNGWLVELVALNAERAEQMAQQAQILAVDDDVTFVLVVTTPEHAANQQQVFHALKLSTQFITSTSEPGQRLDEAFVARYRAISNGVVPQQLAGAAYEATQKALQYIRQSIQNKGKPAR